MQQQQMRMIPLLKSQKFYLKLNSLLVCPSANDIYGHHSIFPLHKLVSFSCPLPLNILASLTKMKNYSALVCENTKRIHKIQRACFE